MTDFDDVVPTQGTPANSYEFIVDIAIQPAGAGTPVWVNIPDITDWNPQHPPKTSNTTTYAHKGGTSESKTGSDFSGEFNMLKIRDATGKAFQPGWQILKDASDAKGEANKILVRWYDAFGAPDAYQGKARVDRARVNTGTADNEWDKFTLTGDGSALPIANPLATP